MLLGIRFELLKWKVVVLRRMLFIFVVVLFENFELFMDLSGVRKLLCVI